MYPKLWRGPGDPPTMGECHTDIRASPNCQPFQWYTSTHITFAHNISSISMLGKAIMLLDKYSFNRQGARTAFTTECNVLDVLGVAVKMYWHKQCGVRILETTHCNDPPTLGKCHNDIRPTSNCHLIYPQHYSMIYVHIWVWKSKSCDNYVNLYDTIYYLEHIVKQYIWGVASPNLCKSRPNWTADNCNCLIQHQTHSLLECQIWSWSHPRKQINRAQNLCTKL